MNEELTLGSIYEDIVEGLSQCRTQSLLGNHEKAEELYQSARKEFERFREPLSDYPGYHALEYAFNCTVSTLNNALEQRKAARK